MRYVLHRHHQEVQKVVDAAHGSWARFRESMLRKYRLGDGLLTISDLEGMNKDDFTTIGAFVQEFNKKARKVHGISEERQCAIFLGLLTGSEAAELTSHGAGSAKLTWATIDRGVEDGSLDQVEQHQMRLQRRKRKERDATASGTPGVKMIVTDVLAALGYGQDAEAQKKAVAVVQGRGKKVRDEGAGQEDYGHTIRFCQQRRDDELAGLISSCMDGDIYDKWGEHIDPKSPRGIRQEALRRAAVGPSAAPTLFRMWQEREDPAIRIEEITGDSEEVTQRLKAGVIKEEPIIVESDDEGREDEGGLTVTTLEKMEDLVEKMGRYQRRLKELCDEVRGWRADLPKVFLYEIGPGPAAGQQSSPGVAVAGPGPRSRMMFRPPIPHGRAPQATQTRSKSKVGPSQPPSQAPSQAPSRKRPEPERRKEVVEVQEEEEEGDDTEDERLRQEEDRRMEQRAQRREAQERSEPHLQEGVPRKRKYTVRLEEDFDVERMVDRLLEGHNDLMNLKDILASTPRLREEFKGRLSQRLVPNVHLSVVLPKEVGWTQAGTRMDWKCAACGLVDLVVKEKKCVAMMDTGAEMNIIRERDALMLGIEIDRADHGVLHGANCKAVFCGTASNVIIEIGKVRARTCFFVMPDVDHPILLGRSFMCRTKTLIFNKHDGTMILSQPVGTTKSSPAGTRGQRAIGIGLTPAHSPMWNQRTSGGVSRRRLDECGGDGAETYDQGHANSQPAHHPALHRRLGGKEKEEDEVQPGVRRFVWRHIQDLDRVLGLLEEHNLTASGPKPKHCMREATILGFVCNEKGRKPDVKKTDKILEWPVPFQTITDVRSFLGTCGFWSSFVKDFAAKTEHLRKLVRQDQEWVWGKDQEEAVTRMKGEFREGGLVLGASNYEGTKEKSFIIETDAGPTALGGVLVQADAEGKERPLRFESRSLNTTERNYSQFKKETLAVLHCLRIFRNYVFGRRFILREDPMALACSLKNYTPVDPTVARWWTYIWMFNFELERIPGNKNRVDGLNRVNWDSADKGSTEDTPPVDGFLDQEEDVRLHINKWTLRVPSCVSHPIWIAPRGYERKTDLVLKPFQEEDPWGAQRPGEPLHPRLEREVGAVVHLDLLFMPIEENGYNYIFDARDNLTGFVDGRAIQTKTGPVLANCIEEYYLRYPFVKEFVMDRGSEFTCNEVRTLLAGYGVVANYTTAAHPQANAPVERGHNTITNLLAKWTEGKPGQWPKFLRAVFFVENITVKGSTKYAPATLWYERHDTFPIKSFMKMWRRQDLEVNLSFEELLDIRARQVGAAEERLREAAGQVERSRMEDKMR
ncbi:hypothetical protein CBR_g34013 [Chara braunii]|uniref:RNA-directed DNA polymerase n=1 Tax=Chara braunii TaxID=69332 RepID=A0A388LHY5_CHABU|nr:hypothetical protein CBR_g34013 [Chara braunii]|eukprot:GBG81832.1 hypothetical protein CBR_g34013 [Chara braunii]